MSDWEADRSGMRSFLFKFLTLTKTYPLLVLSLLFVLLVGCNPSEEKASILSIHSLSSSSGTTRGGSLITITGSNFDSVQSVSFGVSECTGLIVNSSSSVTCTIPAHEAGTVELIVYGKDNLSAVESYTFVLVAPIVTSFSPSSGSLGGGNTLTLVGQNFFSGATVKVGGSSCTSATVLSSTSMTCNLPTKTAGAYSVMVTNDDFLNATAGSTYTYRPAPTVSSFSPTFGTSAGGTILTVTGTGFLAGAQVFLNNTATCSLSTVLSSTSITCLTDGGVAGAYAVSVKNTDNQSGLAVTSFTYSLAPTPTLVTPNAGALAGGTSLTITGSDFISGATVTIDGAACTPVAFNSASSLTCTKPTNIAGTYSVVVTNPNTMTGTLASAYTYQAAPTVSSVSPSGGNTLGGSTITITGTRFKSGPTATVDGVTCTSPTYVSTTSMTCIAPSGTVGSKTVVVTNSDSQTGTLALGYTYRAAPTITSISPTGGTLAGGTTITITGTGFLTAPTVKIGGVTCTSPTYVSATSATCVTPLSSTASAKTVVITNSDLQPSTSSVSYTYRSAPTVLSVSPSGGIASVATPITITGTGFVGSTVSIGGSPCTGVTVVSLTSITCTTPALTAGAKTVTVTNSDFQSGSRASGYTFLAPPTVTSFLPSLGVVDGGTLVTITGTGFFAGAIARIDGTACATTTVISSTSLTCVTPAYAAGPYLVSVLNTDTQSGTAAGTFTYTETPTVTSASPSVGPVGGGTTITITGSGFQTGATVDIGLNVCTLPVVVNETTITCVTPLTLISGLTSITVTNINTLTDTLATGFIYLLAPTISAISSSGGALAGGTSVTITGTEFFAGAVVKFGGTVCTGITVVNPTTITCTLPAHLAGLVTVTVTNADLQVASLPSAYTYRPRPIVTSIALAAGALGGLTSVTITGTGFVTLATATIGGTTCTTPVVVSATSLTCVTPARPSGLYSVGVTNSDGQFGTLASAYTYQAAPTVTAVSPTGGRISGGTTIIVTGTNFKSPLTATVGGVTCTSPTYISATSMSCVTPAGAGVSSIIVSNADTQAGTLAASYTYRAAPTITSISPSAGALAGGTTITITGTGFITAPTIKIGGVTCTSPTYVSATSATCITPAASAGTSTVVITNSDSQPSISAVSYTYRPAAIVTNIVPPKGPATGGTLLTVSGTGFVTGATVRIGGTLSCTPVTFVSSMSLTCTTVAKAAGAYTVGVTNTDGQAGTPASSFTYSPAPTVTSVSQNKGPINGGTNVTVTGTGFVLGAGVSFGGSACGSVLVTSPTSLTCTTTSHLAGAVAVTVTNVDTQFGSAAAAFTYQPPPVVTSVSPLSGTQLGATPVTITGTGFLTGATVKFGNSTCTSPVVLSGTSITCTTPGIVAGAVSVSVLNTDAQNGTTASAYTFTATPILDFQVGVSSPNPPDPDDYGSTITNVAHTFTLKNTGDVISSVITMSISGTDPAAWILGTDNCSGSTLAYGSSCTVQLIFLGTIMPAGAYSAILNADSVGGQSDTNDVLGDVP